MKEFFSKLSFYDILISLFTGTIIALLVTMVEETLCQRDSNISWVFNNFQFKYSPSFVLFSYFFGLIWHKIVESIDWHCEKIDTIKNGCKLLLFRSMFRSNHPALILKAKDEVIKEGEYNDEYSVKNKYIKTYYLAQSKGLLGNIPKIEAHSALLKDVFFLCPIIGGVLGGTINSDMEACPRIMLGIACSLIPCFLLLCARYHCEKKIHTLIWEADEYLKIIENRDNGQCTNPENPN